MLTYGDVQRGHHSHRLVLDSGRFSACQHALRTGEDGAQPARLIIIEQAHLSEQPLARVDYLHHGAPREGYAVL